MATPADRHLRPVESSRVASVRECRTVECAFQREVPLDVCVVCESVYRADHELRERLVARRGAQLHAARPDPSSMRVRREMGRTGEVIRLLASIESGLPALRELAQQDGPRALRAPERQLDRAMRLVAEVRKSGRGGAE
jgi:hypothetical protein